MHENDEVNPFSREYTQQHQSGPRPEPATFQPPVRPPKSNRGIWAIVIVILLTFIGMPLICCGGLLFVGMNTFGMPLDAAVEALEKDDRISGKLGTPIERDTGFTVNEFQSNNGNGHAKIDINVAGPNGSAHVKGKMKQIAGVWSPEDLTVTADDGTEFKLP